MVGLILMTGLATAGLLAIDAAPMGDGSLHAAKGVTDLPFQHRSTQGAEARAAEHNVGAAASVTTSRRPDGIADFEVGDDYTQNSNLATGGLPTAVDSAERLLRSMDTFQNVSLMGWGSEDPEPSPGRYNWGSLDGQVAVMGATTSESRRMITLCTAPGWMKIGGESQEWNMEAAVAPSHYADFAHLAAVVALRYDGHHRSADGKLLPKVDDFDVWNEMKGFWDTATDSWDAAGYTTMYNDVYAAIRAVRPDAEIGGPYAPLGAGSPGAVADPSSLQGSFGTVDQRGLDVVTYWLAHKVGAQFVSMDGGPAVTAESGFASAEYFATVVSWLRSLNSALYPGANSLPIVWAEFYPGLQSVSDSVSGQEAVAVDMSNIVDAGLAGVNDMLIWEMGGDPGNESLATGESVWTDTAERDGGQPTAFYAALVDLHRAFPPGTTLFPSTVTGPVTAVSGTHGVLVISESPLALALTVNGTRTTLQPYAVVVVR